MFIAAKAVRRWLATEASQTERLSQLIKEYRQVLKQPMDDATTDRITELLVQMQEIRNQKKREAKKKQNEKQLDIVKEYVLSVMPKEFDKRPSTQRKIPNNLTLHKLKGRAAEMLLVGVEQNNLEHTLFVRDLFDRLNIENCATQLPPDSPFLIKTQQRSFRQAWKLFIKGNNYSFFMHNRPNYLHQTTLEDSKIGIVKDSIFNSKEYVATPAYGMSYHQLSNNFQPNAFMQPFFTSNLKRLVFCDYPMLKEREYQATVMKLPQLRKLFMQYIDKLHSNQLGRFDARLLHYDQLLLPKIDHIAGVLKLTSKLAPRTLAICDNQYTEFIAESWRKPGVEKSAFEYAECQSTGPFIEFIEKVVILDLILEPIVSKYFIGYKSFPFNVTKTIGGVELINSLFVVWDYYYQKYHQAKFPGQAPEESPLSETDDWGDKYSPGPKAGDN